MLYNFPQTPSRQILGDLGKIIIFCPPNKKICVWEISGGKLILSVPLNTKICLEDFQGELISVSSPNIEIGVRGDLDYSPGQSLLVRRDLT